MTAYQTILIAVFLILTFLFAWGTVKALRKRAGVTDKKALAAIRRKAAGWGLLSLMMLLCAAYVVFRAGWLMLIVCGCGFGAMGLTLGTGVRDQIKEHGGAS